MQKLLPGLIIMILFYTSVNAQSKPDTTVKRDTIVKGDTTIKRDTTVKHDSTVRRDATVKRVTTVKRNRAVKHGTTVKRDSTVKQGNIVKRDSSLKHSPLKTLSYEQYNALIKGDDIYSMSLAAELNHYPSPDKVLKLKKEVNLSPTQISRISAIAKELHRKKLEMGLIIINNERTLDSIFRYNRVDNGSLIFFANRYGLYQGELRNAILQACLATRVLLSDQQVRRYEALQKAN